MVVDAWSAWVAKRAAPQQWRAFLSAFLSSSRATVAQMCVHNAFRCCGAAHTAIARSMRGPPH
eukprot:10569902-Lingulodinium_polyedra.AAC.1